MNHVLYIIPILLAVTIPNAFAQVETTTGENYDLIENYFTGEAQWTSHVPRIMDGEWKNYVLENNSDKVIFNSNSIGSFVFDKNTCSYSIYENGFVNPETQIIPSVSAVAIHNNGAWSNMDVNNSSCDVIVSDYDNGVTLTSTKVITENITNDVFISFNGTENQLNVNGTSWTLVDNNGSIGYFNGQTITTPGIEIEKFVQTINLDINRGIKETFYIYDNSNSGNELGISQTIHVGESIVMGTEEIKISDFDGMSFDRDFIIENESEILQVAQNLNYDMDKGLDYLSSVNIMHDSSFFDNTYKINLDYSDGSFIGYLEIDPTFTNTGSLSGSNWDFDLSTLPNNTLISSGNIDGAALTSSQITDAENNVGTTWTIASSATTHKVHTFPTGTTNFVVTGSGDVEVLVVAGGGAGYSGNSDAGQGGGGAGGMSEKTGHAVSSGTYSVIVGAGGAGATGYQVFGSSGNDSSFDSIVSNGGGKGTAYDMAGFDGGSGGGSGGSSSVNTSSDQTDTNGATGYGNGGGKSTSNWGGGGGGGAGSAGSNSSGTGGGTHGAGGGNGRANSITGSSVTYAGGGGGGGASGGNGGSGGSGGGGNGSGGAGSPVAGTDGLGGGGGSGILVGAAGGDGVVIIKYLDSEISATGGSIATLTNTATSPVLTLDYTVATIPDSINDLSAVFNFPNVDLTFTNPSDGGAPITSFKVYRDTGSGYSLYDTVSSSTLTSYQDTNPVSSVVNYYKINAVNVVGEATDSNIGSIQVGTPPGVPTGLTSTIQDADNAPLDVFLQWSSPTSWGSGTAQGFEIYRDGSLVTTTGLVNSYTDTVTAGAHNHYVKAISSHGISGASNTANITTPSIPDAITDLSGSVISDTQINLSWSAPNDGGSNIDLYKVFQDGSQVDITTNTNYSLTGLSSNTAYAITVYANNSVGDSLVSNTENITTYQSTSGTITVTPNIQGASTQLTFSASGITGTPTPTFSTFTLKEGSTVIASGVTTPYTLTLNDNDSHTYTVTSTDNTHWDTPTISGNTTVTASYDPTWKNNISYNYTRASGVMDLTVNKDSQSLWDATCNYKTTNQVLTDLSGIQSNHTNVWYISESQSIADIDTVYVSCNDDGDTLFSFTSFGPNRLGGGIAQLDDVFGDMTGTPVALIFVLLVAGLFTGRSAPTGILLVLALVGVLGFIGMLTIDEAVWGFLLLAGVLGIFLGKRFL